MDAEFKKLIEKITGGPVITEKFKPRKINVNKMVSRDELIDSSYLGVRVKTAGFCVACHAKTHWTIRSGDDDVYYCGCE